jgi:hypothetical protein
MKREAPDTTYPLMIMKKLQMIQWLKLREKPRPESLFKCFDVDWNVVCCNSYQRGTGDSRWMFLCCDCGTVPAGTVVSVRFVRWCTVCFFDGLRTVHTVEARTVLLCVVFV